MKKTYIEPKNTVVRIKMETMIAMSPTGDVTLNNTTEESEFIQHSDGFGAREAIKSQDAWEEW